MEKVAPLFVQLTSVICSNGCQHSHETRHNVFSFTIVKATHPNVENGTFILMFSKTGENETRFRLTANPNSWASEWMLMIWHPEKRSAIS